MKTYFHQAIVLCSLIGSPLFAQGDFWTRAGGPLGSGVNVLTVNQPGYVFAGTQSNGLFRSTDNGTTWLALGTGLLGTYINAVTVSQRSRTIITGGGFVVYRSTDDGTSWTTITAGTLVSHLDSSPPGVFFAGTPVDGILRSSDDGLSWVHVNKGLSQYSIYAFAFSSTGLTFTSSYGGAVYRSTDNGDNWAPIFLKVQYTDVLSLGAHGDTIICGTSSQGVLRSTNKGDLWTTANSGMENMSLVRAVRFNGRGHLYVGGNGGVYRSLDFGEGWVSVNQGLSAPNVTCLAVDVDGYLYAGTASGQVYRSVQSTTSVGPSDENRPAAFSLEQNYPNPFNPTTKLGFGISDLGFVTLKVYDILGREVATLVDEVKDPGTYAIHFDASGLASGVYLCRLSVSPATKRGDVRLVEEGGAGKLVLTRKLLLLR